MPRSRSRSIESSSCSRISRAETASVISRMRSASVDFPWSMWAMIEKLRILLWSMGLRAMVLAGRADSPRRDVDEKVVIRTRILILVPAPDRDHVEARGTQHQDELVAEPHAHRERPCLV